MIPWLTTDVVELDRHAVADRKLWATLLRMSDRLDSDEWVLVGGQMVALHGYIHRTTPPRTSEDIDIVANMIVRPASLRHCADAAEAIGLEPQPSVSGRRLHRFEGAGVRVDLLVPDHLPRHLAPRVRGFRPVNIAGGQRALDRAHAVRVVLEDLDANVVVPDLRGALVLKARAAVADTRDRERHESDIAFLCSLIDDPRQIAGELDPKERRSLQKVQLSADARLRPWVQLDPATRADAAEAWTRLTTTR